MTFDLKECLIQELEEFGLDPKIINILEKQAYMIRLITLLRCSRSDLMTIPNLGQKQIADIIAAVRAHQAKYGYAARQQPVANRRNTP